MATRVRKTNTEQRILDTAAELFYRNGLRGVGVDQVIAEAGVAKSTLYAHFRTKDELVAAYLRQTDDIWMERLETAAVRAGDDVGEQIVGLFDALLDAAPGSDALTVTLAHVRRRQAWLADLSRTAGAADPEALAAHLGLLIDGALASGRLSQDRAVVDAAKVAARSALANAVPAAANS